MSAQRVRVKSATGMYSVYVGDKILPQGLQAHLPAKVPVAMLVDEGIAALPLTLAIFAWLEKRASRVVRVRIPAGERSKSVEEYGRVVRQLAGAGLFFNSILPGVMGGDVMRAFWAARDAPQARPAAIVSILLERVLGLAATVLLGAALILPRWTELNRHPVTHAGALAFVTVAGILVVILVGLGSPASSRLLAGDPSSGWRKAAAEAVKACHVCLTHPVGAGAGLLLSLISQALLVTLFFTVAEAMALPADFWQLASVLPMVAMVTVLPITWNGLGLREAAFVTFLGVYGVPAVQAVAISLTAFGVILVWNLLGGVVYLVSGVGKVKEVPESRS